jgi:dihydroxyacetone kinase phosphotransfer subunit
MIGIVVVSHSPALARAAVDLALEMVPGERPAISIAAGAGDGVIGTDAAAVASSIDEVASEDGVLVIMDLGSAVMSSEMALEFAAADSPVRLSSAPFVEGLLAAIVTAACGATLDEVDAEARGALTPKVAALGTQEPVQDLAQGSEPDAAGPDTTAQPESDSAPRPPAKERPAERSATEPSATEPRAELALINPDGLHARPAAILVSTLARYDAKITIGNRGSSDKPVAGNSLLGLLSLGAKTGDVLVVSASGPQANEALARVTELVKDGFGELDNRVG